MDKADLPIEKLFYYLNRYLISYYTLLYANALFGAHVSKDFYSCNIPTDFKIISDSERLEDYFELRHETISKQINITGIETLLTHNAHFLRNKAINSFYEIINNYLKSSIEERANYFSYDWFRVLHVLRNSASHSDNEQWAVEFADSNRKHKKNQKNLINPFPDTIKWGKITITRGQKEPIKYSDKDLIELFSYIVSFFFAQLDLSKKI